MALPKEPKFSDFYQPSEKQKQGEPFLLMVALSRSAMPRFVLFKVLRK